MKIAPAARLRNGPSPAPQQGRSKLQSAGRQIAAASKKVILLEDEINADAMIEGAESLIDTEQMLGRFPINVTHSEQIEKVNLALRMNSRIDHVRSIALAYAFSEVAKRDGVFKSYIDLLRDKRKRKNSRTTDLHLVIEDFISYGSDTSDEDNLNARKLYNRDVQAVKYLISQGITPDKVEGYSKKSGQGLDAWARALNKATVKEEFGNDAPEEHQVEDEEDVSGDKNEVVDSTGRHKNSEEPDSFEVGNKFPRDDKFLRVIWVNADGFINKLVVKPQYSDDYNHLQELILGLDMIYARINSELF